MRISTVLLIFILYASCYPQRPGEEKNILAVAGSHQITFHEFSERYTNYILASGVKDNPVVRASILNNMVNELLLRYYDDNTSVLNNPDYLKDEKWLDKQIILAFLKDQEIHAKIPVTENELRETFIRVNESISASHLYAPTEDEAFQLREMLNFGVDWDNLAAQVFSDSVLRTTGGYLGFFTWGDMDPAFEDAAYSLKPGEYSKPVRTSYGYSIIRVEDRKPHPLLTDWQFNLKKPKLTSILRLRKKKSSEREYLNNIINTSAISFSDKELNELYTYMYAIAGNKEIYGAASENILVSFDNKDYSAARVLHMINNIPSYKKEKIHSVENLKTVISGLLLQEKLYNIAVESGYDTIYYVREKLEGAKMKNYLSYKQKEIVNSIPVSDEMLKEYYLENIRYFTQPDEINIQEIIVDGLSTADSLRYLLDNGEEFGKLARRFSLRSWSAENDGVMGYVPVSKLGMLQDLFINAEPGAIVGPVRIEDKFGIFRIIGKNSGTIKEFESVKDIVIQACRFEKRGEYMMNHLKKILSNVNVEINYELLNTEPIAGLN